LAPYQACSPSFFDDTTRLVSKHLHTMYSSAGDAPTPMRSGLERASICLVRVASDGCVSDASSAAAAALRWQAQESLLGQKFTDCWVAEEDRTKMEVEFRETLQGAGTSGKFRQAKLTLPSGYWNAILFIAASRGDAGSVDGIVMVMLDFHELTSFLSSPCRLSNDCSQAEVRRIREDADRAHQEAHQARQQVAELAAELEQVRQHMEPSSARSQNSTRSAASSAAGVSTVKIKEKVMHDLRSPLHGIIGLANTLSEQQAPLHRPLKMISSSATRALDNVTKMVEYFNLAEYPSDRLEEEKKAYDVALLAADVLECCEHSVDKKGEPIQKKGVGLVREIDTSLVNLSWDRHSVNQMLYHLISNSFKFTAKGHVKLRITNDEDSQGIKIAVEDTGIGIAKVNLNRVFEPFQQEDNSLSRKYEGLGLGLAIVRIIVKKCSGTVKLNSKQGQGSTFEVWLPCTSGGPPECLSSLAQETSQQSSSTPSYALNVTGSQPAQIQSTSVSQGTAGAPQQALPVVQGSVRPPSPPSIHAVGSESSLTDLVASAVDRSACQHTVMSVDDDPVNQEVIRQTLEPHGFKIIVCMSGVECLQLMDQELTVMPDIMLLDLGMPGVNGFDVLQAQRKKHGAEVLPIVMVSAEEQVRSVVQGFELGANDWIRKPFEKTEFVARVRAHLRMRDARSRCCSNLNSLEEVTLTSGLLPGICNV